MNHHAPPQEGVLSNGEFISSRSSAHLIANVALDSISRIRLDAVHSAFDMLESGLMPVQVLELMEAPLRQPNNAPVMNGVSAQVGQVQAPTNIFGDNAQLFHHVPAPLAPFNGFGRQSMFQQTRHTTPNVPTPTVPSNDFGHQPIFQQTRQATPNDAMYGTRPSIYTMMHERFDQGDLAQSVGPEAPFNSDDTVSTLNAVNNSPNTNMRDASFDEQFGSSEGDGEAATAGAADQDFFFYEPNAGPIFDFSNPDNTSAAMPGKQIFAVHAYTYVANAQKAFHFGNPSGVTGETNAGMQNLFESMPDFLSSVETAAGADTSSAVPDTQIQDPDTQQGAAITEAAGATSEAMQGVDIFAGLNNDNAIATIETADGVRASSAAPNLQTYMENIVTSTETAHSAGEGSAVPETQTLTTDAQQAAATNNDAQTPAPEVKKARGKGRKPGQADPAAPRRSRRTKLYRCTGCIKGHKRCKHTPPADWTPN